MFIFNPITPSGRIHLNRATLAFIRHLAPLEDRFRAYYFDYSLIHVRICHILAIVFYCLPAPFDALWFPEYKTQLWAIRFLLITPMFLGGLAFTFTSYYRKWWQVINMGYVIASGVGFMAMTVMTPSPGRYNYFAGIIISLMFGYTFLRQRFIYASVAGWGLLFGYVVVSLAVGTPGPLLTNSILYLIIANLLGMLIAYFVEFSARRDFFLDEKLKEEQQKVLDLNAHLEEMVSERTAELGLSNQELLRENEERRKAETALRESESRFRMLFEYAPDGYCLLSTDGTIVDVNHMATNIAGMPRDQIVGTNLLDSSAMTEDQAKRFSMILARSSEEEPFGAGEFELKRPTGGTASIDVRTYPVTMDGSGHVLAIIRDVSERKQEEEERRRLERQLNQSQKMEAIGTLAGGIAHDFNNILSAILGYAELSALDPDAPKSLVAYQHQIQAAGRRARDLIQQILTFSRKRETERKPVVFKDVLTDGIKLLRASIPNTIEILPELETEGSVYADVTQLHQILLNLCTNAAQAMAADGGELTVRLEDAVLDEPLPALNCDLAPGRYLKLTVRDTGAGMSAKVIQRIFDPYFTTKKEGEGTGLGLAVVLGIVSVYQGGIAIDSRRGRGTSIEIYLPGIDPQSAADTTEEMLLPRGSESILFVDDEPQLSEIVSEMLGRLGYEVTAFRNAVDALACVTENPDRFDLVITDMTMPKMNGAELAAKLRDIRADLSILICTGYDPGFAAEETRHLGIHDVLTKPLTMGTLAVNVRQALDNPPVA